MTEPEYFYVRGQGWTTSPKNYVTDADGKRYILEDRKPKHGESGVQWGYPPANEDYLNRTVAWIQRESTHAIKSYVYYEDHFLWVNDVPGLQWVTIIPLDTRTPGV